jgi:hypothetical protein
MKLNLIVAAAALAAAGTANASLDTMTPASGQQANSSIAFIAIDNTTGTGQAKQGSVFIDLGVNVNDFFPTVTGNFNSTGISAVQELSNTNLAASATTAVWNFGTNSFSLTRQGKAITSNLGTIDWSSFAAFTTGTDSAMKWGVIGGDASAVIGGTRGDVQGFLTTGTPTAANLVSQGGSETANMGVVDGLYQTTAAVIDNSVDNAGYYAATNGDAAYVANVLNFGTSWQGVANLKWNALVDTRLSSTSTLKANAKNLTSTNFYALLGEGTEFQVGNNSGAANPALLNNKGTWTLDIAAKTLTWSTPIPEPESYALVIAGLAVMAGVARRRAAK